MKMRRFIVGIAIFMIFLIISMPFCFAQEMTLSYDANGNLVTGDGKYRVYNSLNQLYRVYNGTGTNGTLLYEFKHHPIEERVLVKKTYNSSGSLIETVYYWSQNFITVVNASGSYNFTYVYHNGDLVAQQNPDGSKLFVLGDNKGSTSVITNSSGSVLERTTYSPFGEVLSGGRLNRYGYETKEQELGFGKVPTNGLISYYALEGGAYDDGVGNQGSVANATLTTGKVRDGYSFDGYADYIRVNDSNSLDLTNSFTISVWLNPRSSTQGYVVCKYGSYMIQFMASNNSQGGIWINGTWTTLVSTTTSQNTWTHVVFTYNGTSAVIYKNGARTGSANSTSLADVNTNSLMIGAKSTTDRTRDFNGSIDEVGIWNRALSSTEVADLYNYGASFESGYRTTDFNFRRLSTLGPFFEQPDSIIQNVYDPQSLNRYMFERGNSYKNKDDTGHIIVALVPIVAIVISVAIYAATFSAIFAGIEYFSQVSQAMSGGKSYPEARKEVMNNPSARESINNAAKGGAIGGAIFGALNEGLNQISIWKGSSRATESVKPSSTAPIGSIDKGNLPTPKLTLEAEEHILSRHFNPSSGSSQFLSTVDYKSVINEVYSKGTAYMQENNMVRIDADLARTIGTKGQTGVRLVMNPNSGEVITMHPIG